MTRYLSLFSGIGGLEHPETTPVLVCEADQHCRTSLERQYPQAEIWTDVRTLVPPAADMVVGGWPCQDLSSAGKLGGLSGSRSGLFFEMLRVARESGAHTIIGENVPNLLTIGQGREFAEVLRSLGDAGFPNIAWRVLNARAFGLPQERRRLFIVASSSPSRAEALHAVIPQPDLGESLQRLDVEASTNRYAAGFYWTGGRRSVCFSPGYVPALKIGATDEKGRSPVAVYLNGKVRKLNARENLELQGFSHVDLSDMTPSAILRMAGNAVPAPVGRFVVQSVADCAPPSGVRTSFGAIGQAGIIEDGLPWAIEHDDPPLASNLIDFLHPDDDSSLTAQAAAGLLVRSIRSGLPLPRELFDTLLDLSHDRTGKLHPSRGNSFEALDGMGDELTWYSGKLNSISEYGGKLESRRGPSRKLRAVV